MLAPYLFLILSLGLVCIDGRVEKQPMKLKRRNSDSDLYRKAQGSEITKYLIPSEKPEENKTKYLGDERLSLLQSYLENTEDVGSVATETADSGMPGTHGVPSEFGMEEINGKEMVFLPTSFSFRGLLYLFLRFYTNLK